LIFLVEIGRKYLKNGKSVFFGHSAEFPENHRNGTPLYYFVNKK
jgi:hypothetical protein